MHLISSSSLCKSSFQIVSISFLSFLPSGQTLSRFFSISWSFKCNSSFNLVPNKWFNSSIVLYIFKGSIFSISDSISANVGILSNSDKRDKLISLFFINDIKVLINLFSTLWSGFLSNRHKMIFLNNSLKVLESVKTVSYTHLTLPTTVIV